MIIIVLWLILSLSQMFWGSFLFVIMVHDVIEPRWILGVIRALILWGCYLSLSSGDLTNTSSHICGRWYLPIFLFRDGSLTLISIASLMDLAILWSSLPTKLKRGLTLRMALEHPPRWEVFVSDHFQYASWQVPFSCICPSVWRCPRTSFRCEWTRQQTIYLALLPFMMMYASLPYPWGAWLAPLAPNGDCHRTWHHLQQCQAGSLRLPSMAQCSLPKAFGQTPPKSKPPKTFPHLTPRQSFSPSYNWSITYSHSYLVCQLKQHSYMNSLPSEIGTLQQTQLTSTSTPGLVISSSVLPWHTMTGLHLL